MILYDISYSIYDITYIIYTIGQKNVIDFLLENSQHATPHPRTMLISVSRESPGRGEKSVVSSQHCTGVRGNLKRHCEVYKKSGFI